MFLLNPLILTLAALPAPACAAAPAASPASPAPRACEDAYLGVYVLTAEEGGAAVSQIMPGSPAAEIGLRPGDRIVGLGGEEIDGSEGLTALIADHSAGDEVEILFHRGDEHVSRTVRLGNRAEAEAAGHFPGPVAVEPAPETAPELPSWPEQTQWESFEGMQGFPTAFTAPTFTDQDAERLEQRLDELRHRMDERFADLSQRLQALREERQDGAFHERMSRLQAELEAERADQQHRAEQLKHALREQAEATRQAQAQAQGFRGWASAPAPSAPPAAEVQALREEVQALRDEIRSLKELMTR